MGRGEIETFLEMNKHMWFTVRQISNGLGVERSSVCKVLARLRKANMVDYRLVDRTYYYRYLEDF